MRSGWSGWSGLSSFVVIGIAACSGGKSSSAPPAEEGGTFTYAPESCKYTYTPPGTLAYSNLSVDTPVAADPTMGAPTRVRVGLGGSTTFGDPGYADPTTSAAFTWETTEQDTNAEVMIGTSPTALMPYTGYTWTATSTFDTGGTNFHEVHVCGLTPDTMYYYQVGGGLAGSKVWSPTQTFSTMPATIPTSGITVGLFGDARDTDTTWQAVHVRMKSAGILMSLVSGDVVDIGAEESLYTTWLDDIWQYPASSNTFLTLGQQYILPINGNHENDSTISFANWAIPGDGPYAETYASFTVGSVHFTMVDDQEIGEATSSAEAQAQLAWLEQDLAAAAADRANHPFIVVISHRGLYSTSEHSTDSDVIAARGAMAPLFDKYNVDLVMNGHDHEYERTYPIVSGNPPTGAPVYPVPAGQQGTVYVICAGAGAEPYTIGGGTVAYRAKQQAFLGTSGYIGLYSTLQIMPSQMTLTVYGMTASGMTMQDDTVIETIPFMH